jgi:heat shock protein HspQ
MDSLKPGCYICQPDFDKGESMLKGKAKFSLGEVVRHRMHPFRGVVYDIDAVFDNTEEWYQSIPEELRPAKDQPFYHLLAENDTSFYMAYVSEQNLVHDNSGEPVNHPEVEAMFGALEDGRYRLGNRLH